MSRSQRRVEKEAGLLFSVKYARNDSIDKVNPSKSASDYVSIADAS